jgi:hypothetical protein
MASVHLTTKLSPSTSERMTDAHIGGVSSANIGPNQIFLSNFARFWTFMKAYTLNYIHSN